MKPAAMSKTDLYDPMVFSEAETVEMLREMARDMQVALYRRYDTKEAVGILNIPEAELEDLRKRGEIGYLLVGDNHVAFFGRHLLTYLMQCEVPVGVEVKPKEAPATEQEPELAKPVIAPEVELLSVKDTMALLSIGRTKLYELINDNTLDCVKIGTRTLIKRTSIRRLTEAV